VYALCLQIGQVIRDERFVILPAFANRAAKIALICKKVQGIINIYCRKSPRGKSQATSQG